MLKKSFSTVACMDMDYKAVIEACKRNEIYGVEVRQGNDGSVFGLSDEAELKAMKAEFDKNNIVITDLGSGACFTGYAETAVEAAKQAIDKAAIIKCKAIRVFLGYFAARVNPDKPTPDYNGIVKALKEACAYAKEKNIEIWIETHNEFATGKALKPLIADVNADNLGIIWDVIHPIEDGEKIGETWDLMGESIAHVHIKDGVNRHDPEWHDFKYTRLGEGELPLYELIDLLAEKNFDGYLSLEWETAWRKELQELPQDLDYVLGHYNDFLSKSDKIN